MQGVVLQQLPLRIEPISIKLAKEQNLSLNPSKISGICGRLLCCLRFEAEEVAVEEGPTLALKSVVMLSRLKAKEKWFLAMSKRAPSLWNLKMVLQTSFPRKKLT